MCRNRHHLGKVGRGTGQPWGGCVSRRLDVSGAEALIEMLRLRRRRACITTSPIKRALIRWVCRWIELNDGSGGDIANSVIAVAS